MGKPAARIGDFHACPMVTGVVPHVGGPVAMGSSNVITGNMPQARVGDMAVCVGPPDVIAVGSSGVFVNSIPAARVGDQTAHGGVIVIGLPSVLIGEQGGASGGGGGGGAASGASLAFTAFEAQVKVLMDAAKSGAPFCEMCFQAAQAKAQAALTKASTNSALNDQSIAVRSPAAKPDLLNRLMPSKLASEITSTPGQIALGSTQDILGRFADIPGGEEISAAADVVGTAVDAYEAVKFAGEGDHEAAAISTANFAGDSLSTIAQVGVGVIATAAVAAGVAALVVAGAPVWVPIAAGIAGAVAVAGVAAGVGWAANKLWEKFGQQPTEKAAEKYMDGK